MSPPPSTPIWPPARKKRRVNDENQPPETPGTPTPRTTKEREGELEILRLTSDEPTPLSRRFRNGFVAPSPKTPSHQPYALASTGRKREKPFAFPISTAIRPLDSLSHAEWNALAHKYDLLKENQSLREYQVEGANCIISRKSDLCVVAPTGAGKSTLWTLPLLAREEGISLVVVPFTTLGVQGENRHRNSKIAATFLCSGNASTSVLERIAQGKERHVVYACPEMLETPAVARVLHSTSFQQRLSGVYIDEAHVVLESISWRPSYSRLHLLRKVLGPTIPFVVMSATLPERYRQALVLYAGVRSDFVLISLGNFRKELSTIIKSMQHSARSFLDLRFILGIAERTSVIVYCDDLETLTAMFWWFFKQLASRRLPVSWLNILHAGLSDEHQKRCIDAVNAGRVRILLGSDKIGAGMDFPSIGMVVQFQCRGLSLVRWEQRKGRGARREGLTSTGVILVEKSMLGDSGAPTVKAPKSEDPGLLDLISTDSCLQQCVDKWLENPQRDELLPCSQCSNCNPHLQVVTTHYTFMLENVHKSTSRSSISEKDSEKILDDLKTWRTAQWDAGWKDWPGYGPESLVSTTDLGEISRRALAITTIDHLDAVTSIPHLLELGPSLLAALQASITKHGLQDDNSDDEDSDAQETPPSIPPSSSGPTTLRWSVPESPLTIAAAEGLAEQRKHGAGRKGA